MGRMMEFVPIIVVILGTAALSGALTLLLQRVSSRIRLVAIPVADRWHKTPTPNTGGIAIVFAATIVYFLAAKSIYSNIALAAIGIAVLGALDDRFRLRPSLKFFGQSVLVIFVMSSGVLFRPFAWNPGNVLITFLWIAGVTNAFNLIDNMDGLCAGVVVIIGLSRLAVAFESGDAGGVTLAAILVGAYLGFLYFNYHPAKIFMGDAGSMFAGFALASLAIAGPVPKTRALLSALFYPALTFLYPIFDTTFVSMLRRAAGRPITVGGRDHTSHRLASLGHLEKDVVWLLWGLTAAGAVAGLLAYFFPLAVHVLGTLLIAAVSVFGIFLATLPNYAMPVSAPINSVSWRRFIPTLRSGAIVLLESMLAGIALMAASLMLWQSPLDSSRLHELLLSIPVALGAQIISSIALKTFNLGWRWFGLSDSIRLAQSSLLGTSIAASCLLLMGMQGYSRGVILIYALLSFAFSSGLRLGLQALWQLLGIRSTGRRTAILGSISDVSIVFHALANSNKEKLLPVVVLTTGEPLYQTTVFGLPIHLVEENTVSTLKNLRVDYLVIAGKCLEMEHERLLVKSCFDSGISVFRFQYGILPVANEDRMYYAGIKA
jgi:UDP-GlcNAc:undecaprenyl-phosphate GlcNAc-1-phosphate transferase